MLKKNGRRMLGVLTNVRLKLLPVSLIGKQAADNLKAGADPSCVNVQYISAVCTVPTDPNPDMPKEDSNLNTLILESLNHFAVQNAKLIHVTARDPKSDTSLKRQIPLKYNRKHALNSRNAKS
jgi:hypothetical protein